MKYGLPCLQLGFQGFVDMALLRPLCRGKVSKSPWKSRSLLNLHQLKSFDPENGRLPRNLFHSWPIKGIWSCPLHQNAFLGSKTTRVKLKSPSRTLHVNPLIKEALWKNEPVVALESTIITHGMPFPDNIDTALQVESIVRDQNAIPATVGIINGELIVGLKKEQIEHLGRKDDSNPKLKISRRDLGYSLSKGVSGGTTVSGTMVAAHLAGIPIFVTGGIGGVHYGASESFDVSADLTELGKTPITVICAGVKSILDIGLTLEYLETQGVAVVTFGKSKDFPAFFSARSGFMAPYNLETSEDVARLISSNKCLGLDSGVVIGVPIPEEKSFLGQEIEDAIQKALIESRSQKIVGKDVTPFVLERVSQITKGKSLEANISLIKNNALVGAQIAVEYSKIQNADRQQVYGTMPMKTTSADLTFQNHSNKENFKVESSKNDTGRPVLIGGCNFDLLAVTESYDVLAEMTNTGTLYQTYGGVARNIAECLSRLDHDPLLISAIGVDSPGTMVMERLRELEMDTRGIMVTPEVPTASYSAMMNNGGELLLCVGDMKMHDHITPDYIQDFETEIKHAPIVVIDGNLTTQAIECALKLCQKHQVPVWYEPADISKARKPFTTDDYDAITYVSPNKRELQSIHATITRKQEGMVNFNSEGIEDFQGPSEDQVINLCMRMGRMVLSKIDCLVVTLGKYGVLVLRNEHCDDKFPLRGSRLEKPASGLVSATHYPSANEDLLPRSNIKSVSGAGDCLAGAMIASILRGYDPHLCVKAGLHAAFLSLQTHEAVSDQIVAEKFTKERIEEWMTWSYRDIAV